MLIPNLSVLLAERRLTISKVAQDTGISRTTLTALAGRSARGIQFDTLNRLCQYLKVTPDALFIYRPFDLSLSIEGGGPAVFTVTGPAAAARRFTMACESEPLRAPNGCLEALRVRLSPPEGPDAERFTALLQSLPAPVLTDLERDILAALDATVDPALAPNDYTPDLRWPWDDPF